MTTTRTGTARRIGRVPWLHPVGLALLATLALLPVACSSDDDSSATTTSGSPSSTLEVVEEAGERALLLDAVGETILGQTIEYPPGAAQVSSAIVTIDPGDETGWHHHDAPLYGYVLSGEVVVDYGDDGERTYRAGDAFMEAVGTSHNGQNLGDEPVTILTVNFGAEGVEDTVEDTGP